jgi:Tol biopolymer transport system component
MPLSQGDRLDHFEILAAIGKGGMGEVYKARDTRLNRMVAIKISEASFSERFEREARAIAALNHPNVCTLHDVGPNYLVMEYVEGASPKGPLSLEQGLRIASQVAAALEAAHARGIVHRDLKPGNILVKPDGTVKVLDFGLAKMAEASGIDEADPTAQAPLTEAGFVMGTPAYMAPEQAEGKPIDKRADIWAFGVILFELFSGQRLFKADSARNTLAQVLTKAPDFSLVPSEVQLLLRRCLERDPGRRLRDIGDAMPLVDMTAPTAVVASRSGAPPYFPWAAALAFALAALAMGVVHFREVPAVTPTPVRFRIPYPDGFRPPESALFSLSPDGNTIAFYTGDIEGSRLWVQELGSLEPRVLLGAEVSRSDAITFWSHDSRSILFYADGHLKKADLTGGGAQTLCESPGLIIGGSSSRDQILFGALGGTGIMSVPAAGGTPRAVTQVDLSRKERAHLMPFFLPDGRHFLYLRNSSAAEYAGVYVGSLDRAPGDQPAKRLIATGTGASFMSGPEGRGSVFFLRDGLLMAQEFDANVLELRGEPQVLARGVGNTRAFPFFAASTSGTLVYRSAPTQTSQMAWLDRRGREIERLGDPFAPGDAPRLNPSGTHFALSHWDDTDRTNDLWLVTLSPYRSLRLTRGPARNENPVWSADGRRVAYASARAERVNLYVVNVNGDGQQALLLQSGDDKSPQSWSRDGYLLYSARVPTHGADLWVLPPSGKPFPFLDSPANEFVGSFSPDGTWIAYLSDESGTPEMYLRAFKPEAASKGAVVGPRIPLPTSGAGTPHWRADGREILYIASDGNMMALPVKPGAPVETGAAVALFKAPATLRFDVTPDGQRFLFAIPVEAQQTTAPFTVILNWQAGDRRESLRTP